MRLIAPAVVLAFSFFVAPLAADAQQAGKSARIGYVHVNPVTSSPSPLRVAFIQGLRDFGWVEGSNLAIEIRSANGKPERLPALIADLLRLKVDVILAAEPVLELHKEIVPRLTRVAFVTNPSSPMNPPHVREAQKAATALGIRLQVVEVRDPDEFERALVVIAKDRPDALYVVGNPNLFSQRPRVLGLVERNRLPAIWSESTWVTEGGLIGYASNQPEMFRRGARYVDRILRGAQPADLPVEQPTKFELRINLKTAKALGLTIPQSILGRADQAIE